MAAAPLRFVLLPALVALVAGALAFTLANHVHASDADPGIQPSLQGPQQVSPPDDASGPDVIVDDFFLCPTTVPGGGVTAPDDLSPPDSMSPPDGATGGSLSPPDTDSLPDPSATFTAVIVCALPATGGSGAEGNPWAISIIFALGAGFLALIGLAAYSLAREDRSGR